jgi:hypothetical protein
VTAPTPFNNTDDSVELRKRWLDRYLRIQGQYDTKLRSILIGAAQDAQERVSALSTSQTFSAGVQSAQLRLVMVEIREILKDLYGEILPVIQDGQKATALAAVSAFTETDMDYLRKAFAASGNVNDFVDSQRKQAQLQVANAISRVTKSDIPLSARVYRTRALSTRWVQNTVNLSLVRGASAKEIAKDVRSSIRPNVPGGVSYAAMRLGRTELNNAFHATSIALAQDRPWVDGMRWHLSKVHVPDKRCGCESYSNRIFDMGNVPPKPHPQCRCFITPEVEPFDTFVAHLNSGQYRAWIGNAAA